MLITKNWQLRAVTGEAERRQDEFSAVFNALKSYTPRGQKYNEAKNKLLDNAKTFYKGREKIIEGFKNGIFPLIKKDFYTDCQRPDSPSTCDSSIDESHSLTDKELQIFRKIFGYKNLKSWSKL